MKIDYHCRDFEHARWVARSRQERMERTVARLRDMRNMRGSDCSHWRTNVTTADCSHWRTNDGDSGDACGSAATLVDTLLQNDVNVKRARICGADDDTLSVDGESSERQREEVNGVTPEDDGDASMAVTKDDYEQYGLDCDDSSEVIDLDSSQEAATGASVDGDDGSNMIDLDSSQEAATGASLDLGSHVIDLTC